MRNEAETRAELIDPALAAAGWGSGESRILRERNAASQITNGRLLGAGTRAKAEIADYILVYRNRKLAVVEAKAESLPAAEGVRQAKTYAEKLQLRYTYATNGQEIYCIDLQEGKEGTVATFPTPEELWERTFAEQNDWRDRFSAVPFEDKSGTWAPRYYQDLAIQSALEAISQGRDRILLTLATGTGKTAISFQIAWKLFHAKWNRTGEPTRRPRILFLADRNILANQAYNSFSAFSEDARVRIDPDEIRKKGGVPKNGAVFFTIFQTFMSGFNYQTQQPEEHYGEYDPDFFDLIIIDECHRGGANDESSWRRIMEHFSSAVQIGLTATPKRKHNADTYDYFGEPVFTYALRDGINDGFLTPFRVNQIQTTLDDYRFDGSDEVEDGEVETGRLYEESDFNRIIEIKEREKYRVKLVLEAINPTEKTIIFCATQNHAAAVRDLVNQMSASPNPNYCARVTADDGARGEKDLEYFQDRERTIPTVLTTSQKLSTGVDASNVRHIVLMRPVNSMIEFKQIIGRGTRLHEGKDYFTIHDFVKAYEHFADPEWDGEPEPESPPKPSGGGGGDGGEPQPPVDPVTGGEKRILKITLADGKERQIQHMVQQTFWSPDGTPVSAEAFLNELYGDLPAFFKDEAELREIWSHPETRASLLRGFEEKGYSQIVLDDLRRLVNGEASDLYDVLLYCAYSKEMLTRQARADHARAFISSHYDDQQQAFLDFVLGQYVDLGVQQLLPEAITHLIELKYGTPYDAVTHLGDITTIRYIFTDFQAHLFSEAG